MHVVNVKRMWNNSSELTIWKCLFCFCPSYLIPCPQAPVRNLFRHCFFLSTAAQILETIDQPKHNSSETESWKRPFSQPKRNSHVKWPVKQRAESAHSINRNTTTVWHNRWNKSYWRPLLPRILYCVHVDPLHSKLSTWHVARCCDAYHCTVTQSPFREPTAWDVHGAPTDID